MPSAAQPKMHTSVTFAPGGVYERDDGFRKSISDCGWINHWGWEPKVLNMRVKYKIDYYTPYKISLELTIT